MAEKKAKKAAKKFQIKDLENRELTGRLAEEVKGGTKYICLTVPQIPTKQQ